MSVDAASLPQKLPEGVKSDMASADIAVNTSTSVGLFGAI